MKVKSDHYLNWKFTAMITLHFHISLDLPLDHLNLILEAFQTIKIKSNFILLRLLPPPQISTIVRTVEIFCSFFTWLEAINDWHIHTLRVRSVKSVSILTGANFLLILVVLNFDSDIRWGAFQLWRSLADTGLPWKQQNVEGEQDTWKAIWKLKNRPR